jgi:hypothetical protein
MRITGPVDARKVSALMGALAKCSDSPSRVAHRLAGGLALLVECDLTPLLV